MSYEKYGLKIVDNSCYTKKYYLLFLIQINNL